MWVVRLSKAQHSRQPKHSIQGGHPSQAKASNRGSFHSVGVRVRVRVRVRVSIGVSVASPPTSTPRNLAYLS